LALALLADALGDDARAVRLHQDFKRETVARWESSENHRITDSEIRRIADELDGAQPHCRLCGLPNDRMGFDLCPACQMEEL
jgi:hypothetical protein